MRKSSVKKSKRVYRKRWRIFLPLLLVTFIIYKSDSLILTKKVECYTQFGTCPENIVSSLQWLLNYPLLRPLPTSRVRQQLQSFKEIKSVSLYRRLPRTLVLSIDLRKPIGTIGSQVLGMHAVADEEGVIIGQSDRQSLPLLLDDNATLPDQKLPAEKLQALKILNQLAAYTGGSVVGRINGPRLTVYLPPDTSVILDLAHPAPDWYATLQVILERSKILNKLPKVIDLRFRSPTITF
jgi:cell division septal protein FtsQ